MRILIGITAGIAAYKIPLLIRLFIKTGAEVRCIMTPDAKDFVSPLVISTLSKHPVGLDFWNKDTGEWNNHVEYGEWADVFLIAPCTANTLSKMASGSCDNLLLAVYLSMRNKTIVSPAMDLEMYQHPTVKRNLALLTADGVHGIPPDHGELASGLSGEGRLPEPEIIFEEVVKYISPRQDYINTRVLVTAGPTYEAIDPVRFIGNHASGKMGFALAENFANRGALVILITGPTALRTEHKGIQTLHVTSAMEMFEAVQMHWEGMDLGVFSAAVADYRPIHKAEEKIKKTEDALSIELIKNPDILAWAGEHKASTQRTIGFALETNNAVENAKDKLARKHADAIVLNVIEENENCFNSDTNKVRIFDVNGLSLELATASKARIAQGIVDYITRIRL
ncbi:MAG: bifunctional phosphopantothenoylcysteine decarboxylase/phosphopantothenate--cysteine ligase CoaBC [Cryomorphaceae bacterium]|nr:bifunctional phosphopantothenoylcysteine decarboxylase/phosphopantothenate--cysteine ligase CoaBC [Cryomorphaceae bacterium]